MSAPAFAEIGAIKVPIETGHRPGFDSHASPFVEPFLKLQGAYRRETCCCDSALSGSGQKEDPQSTATSSLTPNPLNCRIPFSRNVHFLPSRHPFPYGPANS